MLDKFQGHEVSAFLDRLESCLHLVRQPQRCVDRHPSYEELWSNAGASRTKMLSQESSLINVMEAKQLLQEPRTLVCEMGCGTANFSWHLALAKPQMELHFMLLDRETFRSRTRVDYRIRAATKGKVTRVTVDMRDFGIEMLPPHEGNVMFISKHFCGPATDMALDLFATLQLNGTRSLCMATCCHGTMAQHEPFGGLKHYIHDVLGLSGPHDWEMLCSTTSWATLAVGSDEDFVCPATGRTRSKKRLLGRLCKIIIDESRVRALHRLGFVNAELLVYTSETVEDRVIVCKT